MTRQQQTEIRRYAEKLGLEVVRFEKRSKHDAAILSNGRRERFITLSATPSDFRTGYAVQRDIRKVARELRELEPPTPTVILQDNKKTNFPWLRPVEQPAPIEQPKPEHVKTPRRSISEADSSADLLALRPQRPISERDVDCLAWLGNYDAGPAAPDREVRAPRQAW